MKEKDSKFFRFYYILTILYSLFGIYDSYTSTQIQYFGDIYHLHSAIGTFFMGLVFSVSIAALIIFIREKFKKLTLVMPAYRIGIELILIIGYYFWAVSIANSGGSLMTTEIPDWVPVIGIITSGFEFGFSMYILNKFK